MPSPLELKTDAEYIAFLTHEYGWQIDGPSYTAVPQPHEKYIGRNQRRFDLIKHYLTGTYIIRDQFDTDHKARRLFLEEFELVQPNVKEWIDSHSKLKMNRIYGNVLLPIFSIVENLESTFPEVYRQLQNCTSDLYRDIIGYDGMSFDKKVSLVRRVDEVAYRFLEELGK